MGCEHFVECALLPLFTTRAREYFFWSGKGGRQTFVRDVTRTMGTLFKASAVPRACSHRFRHTLAAEVLEMGGTFEDAADILSDTRRSCASTTRSGALGAKPGSAIFWRVWRTEFQGCNPLKLEEKIWWTW